MLDNSIVFYISSFIIILFMMLSLSLKNIIYSLLCSIVVFLMTSLMFYQLGSEYNAIIQVIVYAIAIPILIGLSIMLINYKKIKQQYFWIWYLVLIFSLVFIQIFMFIFNCQDNLFNIMETAINSQHYVLTTICNNIYINNYVGLELLSLLLTVVVIGFIMIRKDNDE